MISVVVPLLNEESSLEKLYTEIAAALEPTLVEGVRGRLDRAVANLLDNAAKHGDGRVEVFDSVYPFLGADTSAGIVAGLGAALSEKGELLVDRHQMTTVPGLYAIGDIVSGLNQISVAVGQAALAATHLHNALPFAPRISRGAKDI